MVRPWAFQPGVALRDDAAFVNHALRPHIVLVDAVPSPPRTRPLTAIDDIRADFDLLDSWEDRYRYVMELGRALPAYPESLRTDVYKVRGCASQVWLATHIDGQGPTARMTFDGDSDSHLVRGLVAILLAAYQGCSAKDALAVDAHAILTSLGLAENLTPQRSNGFASMVARIREDAGRLAGDSLSPSVTGRGLG